MTQYLRAYLLWFSFVTAAAAVAVAWYRHVEEIGLKETGERLKKQDRCWTCGSLEHYSEACPHATEDTGDTDGG